MDNTLGAQVAVVLPFRYINDATSLKKVAISVEANSQFLNLTFFQSRNKGDAKKVRRQERKSSNEEKAIEKISPNEVGVFKKKSPKREKVSANRKSPNFEMIDDFEDDDFKVGQKQEPISSKSKVQVVSTILYFIILVSFSYCGVC